ncbi:MAG TPA: TfoX/Sxy family protein, partial [Chitinispirillaceae bacterium]|nr:TfoX/Sxy family protein [Chitinispirillaceae bacterium]
MTSKLSFVQYIADQIRKAGQIRFRKMFGEYAIYCNDKVVALVCDNQLFIKPTQGGRKFIGNAIEALPYPGASPYLLIDKVDDDDWLVGLVKITCDELPHPKKKSTKACKVKPGPEKMAANNKPLLNDEHEFPDESVLGRNLGGNKKLWTDFLSILSSEFASISLNWKYYL